jgi:hypothetical protein
VAGKCCDMDCDAILQSTDPIPLYEESSRFILMFAVWPVWNKVLGLAKILKWSGSIAINLASGLLPYFRLKKKKWFHFWNTYRISRNYVHVLHVKTTHATIILLNVCWSLYKLETILYSLKLENVKWYGNRLSYLPVTISMNEWHDDVRILFLSMQ